VFMVIWLLVLWSFRGAENRPFVNRDTSGVGNPLLGRAISDPLFTGGLRSGT
jgi:hypothetical protein